MSLSQRERDYLVYLTGKAAPDDILAAVVRARNVQTSIMPNGETRVMFRLPARTPAPVADPVRKGPPPARDLLATRRDV